MKQIQLKVNESLYEQLSNIANDQNKTRQKVLLDCFLRCYPPDTTEDTLEDSSKSIDVESIIDVVMERLDSRLEHDIKAIVYEHLNQYEANRQFADTLNKRDTIEANLEDTLEDTIEATLKDTIEANLEDTLEDTIEATLKDTIEATLLTTKQYLKWLHDNTDKEYKIGTNKLYAIANGEPVEPKYNFVIEYATLVRDKNNKPIWRLK